MLKLLNIEGLKSAYTTQRTENNSRSEASNTRQSLPGQKDWQGISSIRMAGAKALNY